MIFAIVNAFRWLQDFALGAGVDYAWWITIPWGMALSGRTDGRADAQAVSHFVAGRHWETSPAE